MLRKKYVREALVLALAGLVAGCGSSSSSNNTPPPTGIKKRVLISNQPNSVVNIIDAQRDTVSTKTIGATSPTKMLVGGTTTLIMDNSTPSVTIFDNTTEAVTFNTATADVPFDIALTPDGTKAWVAVRNPGFVQEIDTTTGVIIHSSVVPSASRLVMSPNGSKLLAFSDDPQTLATNANSFFVIDVANPPANGTPITLTPGDQPFSAVFAGSETTAFILNCGSECGGTHLVAGTPTPTAPSVLKVDLTGAAPSVPVSNVQAATSGLLNNGKLFIAGTLPGSGGSLQVADTTTLVAGAVIPITDGHHNIMTMASNNHLYIGSAGCTPAVIDANTVRGCLSIFNTGAAASSTNPVFPAESAFRQNFDVTAFQPISSRTVMYVCQGAELDIFDINSDAVATGITPIDLQGKAFGLVQIDP